MSKHTTVLVVVVIVLAALLAAVLLGRQVEAADQPRPRELVILDYAVAVDGMRGNALGTYRDILIKVQSGSVRDYVRPWEKELIHANAARLTALQTLDIRLRRALGAELDRMGVAK